MNRVEYEAPFSIVWAIICKFSMDLDGDVLVPVRRHNQHGSKKIPARPGSTDATVVKEIKNKHDLPKLRLLLHKLGHQVLALLAIHHDNFLAAVFEELLSTHKVLVLANDHTIHLVENAGAGAHITGRQGGVHSGALVGGGGETTGVFESGHLGLVYG